jgi:hypothetical protein
MMMASVLVNQSLLSSSLSRENSAKTMKTGQFSSFSFHTERYHQAFGNPNLSNDT